MAKRRKITGTVTRVDQLRDDIRSASSRNRFPGADPDIPIIEEETRVRVVTVLDPGPRWEGDLGHRAITSVILPAGDAPKVGDEVTITISWD